MVPYRRCIACRRSAAKASLLRFVVSDGVVRADPLSRHPGRGAYLCGRPSCTQEAVRRDGVALRRALRAGGDTIVDEREVRDACERHAARMASRPGGVQQENPGGHTALEE